jgi:hypothetical protein
MSDAITLIRPEADMLIRLEVRDEQNHRWRLAAKFEYGIHAMEAARGLSEADTRPWRVVDTRWEEGPMILTYTKGTAS